MFRKKIIISIFLFFVSPFVFAADPISCASLLSTRHQAALLFITGDHNVTASSASYMKAEKIQTIDVIQSVFARYKLSSYFPVPAVLEVHFQGFWYNFNYSFRRIMLPFITERSNQTEEIEMVPDLELRAKGIAGAIKPAYEPKIHRYKITEQISSVVHEVAHSILDEKIRLEIPEFKELFSLLSQYRRVDSRRERFVELLKPPDKDYDSWTEEDHARFAANSKRAIPVIAGLDKSLTVLRLARNKLEGLMELLIPYSELFADLAVFEYTKSDTAMIENMAPPGEPISQQGNFRLFRAQTQQVPEAMVDVYTITAPTRSWIRSNLIGSRVAPNMQDMQIVAEAIVQEIKQRVQDPSLQNLNPEQLNNRLIWVINWRREWLDPLDLAKSLRLLVSHVSAIAKRSFQ